jgi:hypothetical protein
MFSCSDPAEDKKTARDQVSKTDQIKNESVQSEPSAKKQESDNKQNKEPDEKAESVKVSPSPGISSNNIQTTDIIALNDPAYSIHKKGIVLFTHKKHIDDYGIGCGECHHDKKGKPLNALKEGDNVENCITCHTKAALAPKQKGQKKLTDLEKRAYHAEALHDNCIDCHKQYNKKNNTKATPTSCTKCHPKKK